MSVRFTFGSLGTPSDSTGAAIEPQDNNTPCDYGTSSGNTLTCLHFGFDGDGARMASSARVENSARVLESCLYENGGLVGCSGYGTTNPGQVIQFAPAEDFPVANYCAITNRENADGSVTQIGDICSRGN